MNSNRQKVKKHIADLGGLLCIMAAFAGCASVQTESNVLKAEVVAPAPDAGFIGHPERQIKREDLPFQKVWIKLGFKASAYQELVVAPVNTQYMMEMDWMHQLRSANLLQDIKKDIGELAQYFREQVIKEFRADPNHRFQVIEFAKQHKKPALRMELALIEINPVGTCFACSQLADIGWGHGCGCCQPA